MSSSTGSKGLISQQEQTYAASATILIVIAILLLLVSAIFISIVYYQVSKLTQVLPKNVKPYLLTSMILSWIGFVISLILLGTTFGGFSMLRASDEAKSKEKQRRGDAASTITFIGVFVVAVVVLAAAIIDVLLTTSLKSISNSIFTNILIAAIAAVGGFVFLLLGTVVYAVRWGYSKGLFNKKEKKVTETTKTEVKNENLPEGVEKPFGIGNSYDGVESN